MADSTTNIPQISSSQSFKEVTANANFDAASQAMIYGRNSDTTSALTWGYIGGRYNSTSIANGTVSLTGSTTNYIVADKTTGAVSVSTATTNWDNSTGYERLYKVVTGSSSVTSYEDHRSMMGGGGNSLPGGGSTGQVLAKQSGADGDADWESQPFYVQAQCIGAPSAGAFMLYMVVACAVVFPDDFAGSYAKAAVAATASTVFDIKKNGVSVGSITFAISGTSATFVTSGGTVSLAAGDILSIVAPGSADATLATIGFALAGTR